MPAKLSEESTLTPGVTVSPLKARETKESVLFTWEAPSRVFQPKSREYYVRILTIAALFGIILFIIEGIMPVFLMVAVLFLFYVLNTVPPETLTYQILETGLKVGTRVYTWDTVGRFWFSKDLATSFLNLELFVIPGRMRLIVESTNEDKIRSILGKHLVEEEIPATQLEKLSSWVAQRIPQ